MAEVALENIHKTFPPDVHALRDFSLQIAEGELMVLVGPSGCGKTTCLRLIAGLDRPARGSIRIGGRCVNDLPPRERDVAMVFQRQALYPHLTVRENLAFGLRRKRGWWPWGRAGPESEERIIQTARLLGLETVLDRRPGQLSGGQQQRVALGRALVRQPAVFLLDEPLSHLDSRLRNELRRELHLLHRQTRVTMIYVTHDPVEAMTLADRVAVLDGGTVQQVDEPLAIYERPINRRVAEFFGWPPMNLIDGRIVTADGQARFVGPDDFRFPLKNWAAEAKGQVTLGIRPEALQIYANFDRINEPTSQNWEGAVRMRVSLVEPLGHATLVTLEKESLRLLALAESRAKLADGTEVNVRIDMKRIHWFEGITGRAMATG